MAQTGLRLGLDLGGTKIEGALFALDKTVLKSVRIATPRDDYGGTIQAICNLVASLEGAIDQAVVGAPSIGIGVPGSISPLTGVMQNANSTWLNGRPFDRDLAESLGRPVRLANDANCFALSEAADGAGAAC